MEARGVAPSHLIRDRDTKFSRAFDDVWRSTGARIIPTPVRTPVANAYAERWVGNVRRECLDHLLIVNRRHLERVLKIFVGHYNPHRPHRGVGGASLAIGPMERTSRRSLRVRAALANRARALRRQVEVDAVAGSVAARTRNAF